MSRHRAPFAQPSRAISAIQVAYSVSVVGVNNGRVAYVFEFCAGQSLNLRLRYYRSDNEPETYSISTV